MPQPKLNVIVVDPDTDSPEFYVMLVEEGFGFVDLSKSRNKLKALHLAKKKIEQVSKEIDALIKKEEKVK